jgi:hypothetical protein
MPAYGRFSWYDGWQRGALGEMFGLIERCSSDEPMATVIDRAIKYYVHGNRPRPVEIAVASSQMAFELLAWLRLREQGGQSKQDFKNLSAAQKMRAVLNEASISDAIPDSLDRASELAAQLGATDGPELLTRMRNGFVHPAPSKRAFGGDEWVQGWILMQWYLELSLLHLLGYTGQYSCRLPDRRKHVGDHSSVPWTSTPATS